MLLVGSVVGSITFVSMHVCVCVCVIAERLADSLRLPSVPSVQAQVFLCFRVLIMRVSPHHLTSLWPTIITELVRTLLQGRSKSYKRPFSIVNVTINM